MMSSTKWLRCSLAKRLFLFFTLSTVLIFNPGHSFSKKEGTYDAIGLRGGVWRVFHSKNITAPPEYKVSTKTYSPYMELFFTHPFSKDFSLELLFGSLSRGETRFDLPPDGYYWESVNIIPVSLGAKYSFLPSEKRLWHPYVDGGVSFILGSRSLDYGSFGPNQREIFSGFVKTKTALGFFAGSGLDFSVSELLWLNLDLKYQGAKFSSAFGDLEDYSGIRLNMGLSYIIKKM